VRIGRSFLKKELWGQGGGPQWHEVAPGSLAALDREGRRRNHYPRRHRILGSTGFGASRGGLMESVLSSLEDADTSSGSVNGGTDIKWPRFTFLMGICRSISRTLRTMVM